MQGHSEYELFPDEPMLVVVTESGHIKRVRVDHAVSKVIAATSHMTLEVHTSKARVFEVPLLQVPQGTLSALGAKVSNLLPLEADETVTYLTATPRRED